MSSTGIIGRLRCASVVGALLVSIGTDPSAAKDEIVGAGAVDSPADPVDPDENPSSEVGLSLRDALAFALENSPDLASFSWEIRAREARTLQAGLLPNPDLRAEVENIGGSGSRDGFKSTETTLFLIQLIELGGKRGKRQSISAFDEDIAEWEYELARLEIVADTTDAFVAALARQEAVRIEDEQIRSAEAVLREIEEQVRAGAASSAEIPRAEVEVANQQIERSVHDRALRAAYVRLATIMGDSEPTFSAVAGDLSVVVPIPSEAELVEKMAFSLELERWQVEVAKRRAAIELEDAQRIPDVTVGVGPRHFNDDNDWALVAGIEVPVPVFDRNQGGRQESRDRLSKSREEERSAKLRLRYALAQSYRDLAFAYDEITTLRDTAIPSAERAYEEVKRDQKRGVLGFSDVLDSQRSLFDLRIRLVAALASYHSSRAQTEVLIGGVLTAEEGSAN